MPHARRFLFLSRSAVTTALAFAFVLLAGTAVLTILSIRGMMLAHRETINSERHLATATDLLAGIVAAETAARARVALGDETTLRDYSAARENVRRGLVELRREFGPIHGASALLDELHRLTLVKISGLDAEVTAGPGQPTLQTRVVAPDADSLRLSGEIQRLGHLLARQEFALLSDVSARVMDRGYILLSLSVALIGLTVALTAVGAWWLLRRVRDLEGLITVCAWTRRVQWQGRWVSFEEYLLHRFHLRCTHGICDEAAEKMRKDAAQMVLSLGLPPEMMAAPPPAGPPILEPASDT